VQLSAGGLIRLHRGFLQASSFSANGMWADRHCDFRSVVLSVRDIEEAHVERGLSIDHTTVWRFGHIPRDPQAIAGASLRYQADDLIYGRLRTFASVAAGCTCSVLSTNRGRTGDFYLSETRDREAAKRFSQVTVSSLPPLVFLEDGSRRYPAAIRPLKAEGDLRQYRDRCRQYGSKRIE
jgi:transposase-like protein